jgi:hypothetical protein
MPGGSFLAVEDLFASGDSLFVEELRANCEPPAYRAFALKWMRDTRPWARTALHDYLDGPLNCPGHEPLLRPLFMLSEKAGDDETMARWLVALDRAGRRALRGGALVTPPNLALPKYKKTAQRPRVHRAAHNFSLATLRYLRRRAWRYFRRLGFKDPGRYLHAVVDALSRYRDADFTEGANLLDNWGLVHALFHGSEILLSRPWRDWQVRPGRALRDLKPAPSFPEHWTADGEVALLKRAQSRPVRRSAMAMLRKRPIGEIGVDRLLPLLDHEDGDVALLAASLVENAPDLASIPAETWLRLLDVRNPTVLDVICSIVTRVVNGANLSDDDVLRLCTSGAAPVARMAVGWLKGRRPASLALLARVTDRVAAKTAVAFAREHGAAVIDFLDSPCDAVRREAWPWFAESGDRTLWPKLLESPYDDIRLAIVGHLARRADTDRSLRDVLDAAPIETIWATVLFNIHRGSRAKRHAVGQVADAIERAPARASQLLPLLSVAARSVRAPEFRAGLAAVVRTAVRRPEVAEAVARHFPELKL